MQYNQMREMIAMQRELAEDWENAMTSADIGEVPLRQPGPNRDAGHPVPPPLTRQQIRAAKRKASAVRTRVKQQLLRQRLKTLNDIQRNSQ